MVEDKNVCSSSFSATAYTQILRILSILSMKPVSIFQMAIGISLRKGGN